VYRWRRHCVSAAEPSSQSAPSLQRCRHKKQNNRLWNYRLMMRRVSKDQLTTASFVNYIQQSRDTCRLLVCHHCLTSFNKTRKPSCRKRKRPTAVRAWRPPAKKSTANQSCDFISMVNCNYGRITYRLWDIFAYTLEIAIFAHCIVIIGTPSNINLIYTSQKSTFSGLQFCLWHRRSLFIRLAVIASKCAKSLEIPKKFELIAVQGHPRSSILV